MWPTKKQRIMGRLSLIRQQLVMFMAWLPYSQASVEGANHLAATTDKAAVQAKGQCLHILVTRRFHQTNHAISAQQLCHALLVCCNAASAC